ncbi:MAG: FMN-binding protein [Defluviitaleaceae bacterium]|nr:FMN-binding protein [Defluviitaleaceae bacterium]
MKKKLLGMLIAAFAIGAFAACSRPVPEPEASDLGATAPGYIDWIGVELIMDGDRIVDIDVDWNAETPAFISMIYGPNRQIVQDVIDRQGTDGIVTAGSGATVSANAFLIAVNEVLERLGMEVGEIYVPEIPDAADWVPSFGLGENVEVVTGWAYEPSPRGNDMDARGNQPIAVQVHFTANNERIDRIEVDFNRETEMFVSFMHPSIVDQIVAQQSVEGIDTSNGATHTSNAVIEAVQAVLDRVGFVAPELDEDIDENGYEDIDEDVDADEDEPADDPAPPTAGDTTPPAEVTPPVAAGRFNPGSFRGTSNDTYSHRPDNDGGLSPTPLVVEITVDDNNITGLTIVSHGETQIFVNMTNAMQQAIVANNGTAGVAATAGATYTALAIIEATEAAIAAAER